MVDFKRCLNKKMNNKGSALVTVIVVVTFLTILATMVLYLSGMNYIMKVTDRGTKESFYTAETALEEIKAGLGVIASEAVETAYVNNMAQYSVDNAYTRYSTFEKKYFDEFSSLYEKKAKAISADPSVPDYESLIKSMVEPHYASCVNITNGELDLTHKDDGYLVLKDIKIIFTDSNNYTAIIKTSFVFTVPSMNWAVNESYRTDTSANESKTVRDEYNICDYINYYEWERQ